MATFNPHILQHAAVTTDNIIPSNLLLDETALTAPFLVTGNTGPYLRGEVVTITLATGAINKLTVPPTAGEVLGVVSYGFTNTAAAVTAGNANGTAQIYTSGLFNEQALIFGGTATLVNSKTTLNGSGIRTQTPLAFN